MDLISQVNNSKKPEETIGVRTNAKIIKVQYKADSKEVSEAEARDLGITTALADGGGVAYNNFNLKSSGHDTWALERLIAVTGVTDSEQLLGAKLSGIPKINPFKGENRVTLTALAKAI